VNNVKAIQKALIQKYQEAHERKLAPGLMSGFYDLDRLAGGMMAQEMIVVGGVPSAGKTTLAMNIGLAVAQSGVTVSVCSLETSAEKLIHRFHCMAGRVDGGPFLRGEPTEGDFPKITAGINRVNAIADRLLIHDESMSDTQLAAVCRRDYQRGARLFIVDYLQLIQSKGDGEFERVTKASKCIKSIAKELNCPVIVVSALSRQEKGKPRKPSLNDLKQSGQIEYDADKVYLLHCETNEDIRAVECDVAKNKDGAKGTVSLTLFACQFRFESTSPVSAEDVPHPYKD
jgi:replicative DNA helicase